MKTFKHYIILLLLCLFMPKVYSQQELKLGSYYSRLWESEYDITASRSYEKTKLFMKVRTSDNKQATLVIGHDEYRNFVQMLQKLKSKYEEWNSIADSVQMTNVTKDFDFYTPPVTIMWQGVNWWFAYGVRIKPTYIITENGHKMASFVKKVTASKNRYIETTITLTFISIEEIDEILSIISPENVKRVFEAQPDPNKLLK